MFARVPDIPRLFYSNLHITLYSYQPLSFITYTFSHPFQSCGHPFVVIGSFLDPICICLYSSMHFYSFLYLAIVRQAVTRTIVYKCKVGIEYPHFGIQFGYWHSLALSKLSKLSTFWITVNSALTLTGFVQSQLQVVHLCLELAEKCL